MKKLLYFLVSLTIVGISGCDILLGPNTPLGKGTLSIGFGDGGGGRSTRSLIDEGTLAALQYELVLSGPDNQTINVSLAAGKTYKEQVSLGEWRIEAEAYNDDNVLFGKGMTTVRVRAGTNEAEVSMRVVPVEVPPPAAVTVTFNANGGTPAPEAQTVASGGTVTTPPAMTRTGHTFGGWFKEAAFNNQWNFSTDTVMGDTTLYAKWTYTFTTPAQYRDMIPLSGGTINGAGTDGTFISGRTVTLGVFSIAKYETTWELWEEVRVWAESNDRGTDKYNIANDGYQGHQEVNPGSPTGTSGSGWTDDEKKHRPVTNINWRDAIVWCNAYSQMSGKEPVYYTDTTYATVLRTSTNTSGTNTEADKAVMKPGAVGYRLPTEAEWEYAARGGDQSDAAWSYTYAGRYTTTTLGEVAWYDGNSYNLGTTNVDYGAHPAGTKGGNGAGLFDMTGNVYEWCWDWYGSSVGTGMESNPAGPASGTDRVHRGSSWRGTTTYCETTYRHTCSPSGQYGDLGFRLVVCP